MSVLRQEIKYMYAGERGSGLVISALKLTIELLQDSLHGTGAAATAHGNVEFVLMVRHDGL